MTFVVAFEGIDNSGKTTMMNAVYEELTKINYKCGRFFSIAGDGNIIRALSRTTDIETRLYLFSALRASNHHYFDELRKDNDIVLMDRSPLSNYVYGNVLGDQTREIQHNLYFSEQNSFPVDATVITTVDGEEYARRLKQDKLCRAYERDIDLMFKIQTEYLKEARDLSLEYTTEMTFAKPDPEQIMRVSNWITDDLGVF